MTVKVAVVELAGTVTLEGTVAAAVLALDSETIAPPAGAGPVKITVPVEGVPPMTDVGFKVKLVRVGAVTVKVVLRMLPRVADMVTGVLVVTGLVVAVKVAVVAFGATVTLAGTWTAAGLLLVRLTTAPPAGASPEILTVPVEDVPPRTDAGLTEMPLTVGVVTVKVAVLITP